MGSLAGHTKEASGGAGLLPVNASESGFGKNQTVMFLEDTRFHLQRVVRPDGEAETHFEFSGQALTIGRDDCLRHSFVEDGANNSAVNNAREALPSVAYAPNGTDQAVAHNLKMQMQTVWIITAARKALSFERGGRVGDGVAFYYRLTFHSASTARNSLVSAKLKHKQETPECRGRKAESTGNPANGRDKDGVVIRTSDYSSPSSL